MAGNPIVIIGTGAEARIALDIFNALDVLAYGAITRDKKEVQQDLNDITIFGMLADKEVQQILEDPNVDYFVTYGDIKDRRIQYEAIAGLAEKPAVNCVHPLAFVSPYAKTGFGNLMNVAVAINANAEIGDNNLFHSGASVEPDAKVGSYCNISAGARIGGQAEVGDEVFIGTGAIIYPGVKIGKGALIGAGAVVLKEVDAGQKVFGNPAKSL